NIKGEGMYLIPHVFRDADDRTCIGSFVSSLDWAGKDYTLELWCNNKNADKFWKAVLTTATIDIGAKTPASPAIPVEINAAVKIKVENETFKDVTLVHDSLVAQCKGKFPSKDSKDGKSAAALLGEVSSSATFNLLSYKMPMGYIELQDHGAVKAAK